MSLQITSFRLPYAIPCQLNVDDKITKNITKSFELEINLFYLKALYTNIQFGLYVPL